MLLEQIETLKKQLQKSTKNYEDLKKLHDDITKNIEIESPNKRALA